MKFTVVIFTLILAACLTACGTLTPVSAAESFLDACVDYDEGRMLEVCPTMELRADDAPIFARMTFSVGEASEVMENIAEVSVTITAPDVPKLYAEAAAMAAGDAIAAMLSPEKDAAGLSQTLAELAAAEDAPMKTSVITLRLQKSGMGWSVSTADELTAAIFGDAITAIRSFT